MSTGSTVDVHHTGALTTVSWSRRSAANAFDRDLAERILTAVHDLASEPPRILVLAGEDGRFSAGLDLTENNDEQALAWRLGRIEILLATVRAFPAITVANVCGPAFGAGADLVTACDYRVGRMDSRFRFPGPRFGVVLGTHQLRFRVGAWRATDILLRNQVVLAEDALAWGILTHLVESSDEWDDLMDQLQRDTADLAPDTIRALLRILRDDTVDGSAGALLRSVHSGTLADRVDAYRRVALTPR